MGTVYALMLTNENILPLQLKAFQSDPEVDADSL